jgi:hypothetical protein
VESGKEEQNRPLANDPAFLAMRLYAATGTYIPVDGGFLAQWKLQELKQTPNVQLRNGRIVLVLASR